MTEPQLPEPLRRALKDRTAYKPPETFYQDVLRTIRKKEAPRSSWAWLWGTPVKLAASLGVVMVGYVVVKNQMIGTPQMATPVYDQVNSVNRSPAFAELAVPVDKNDTPTGKPTAPAAGRKTLALDQKKMAYAPSLPMAKSKAAEADQFASANAPLLDTRRDIVAAGQAASPAKDATFPAINTGPRAMVELQTRPALRERAAPMAVLPLQSAAQAQQYNEMPALANHTVPALKEELAKPTPLVWEGRFSRTAAFQTVVVTAPAQWAQIWQSNFDQPAPPLDFNISRVVGVFAGRRPDLVGVRVVQALVLSDRVRVIYREIPADRSETSSANSPYSFRAIPKTDLPISFEKQR